MSHDSGLVSKDNFDFQTVTVLSCIYESIRWSLLFGNSKQPRKLAVWFQIYRALKEGIIFVKQGDTIEKREQTLENCPIIRSVNILVFDGV